MNAALADQAMGGILGAALGESAEQTQARIEEAKKSANDLTGLVRKKAKEEPKPAEVPEVPEVPKVAEPAEPQANGENGAKRKAEEPAEDEDSAKKAKVEETVTAEV